jgi:hypothetical protein
MHNVFRYCGQDESFPFHTIIIISVMKKKKKQQHTFISFHMDGTAADDNNIS